MSPILVWSWRNHINQTSHSSCIDEE